ncbi:MAG TPA: FAD-dependent oxidoreductase [Niabella sp.]|nr:FAD-dependent oxidoreductase [Niabella sp.]
MKKYLEQQKEIPVIDEVDVLVVGGGPSGVGAAIGAAKTGANTMVIEALSSFGGMWTNGLVITLGGFNNWLRPYERNVDGVMGEWLVKAEKMGGAENSRSWVLDSDPEIMRVVADKMMEDYKVKCLLHTWFADAIVEDNQIKGIIVENVDGRQAIMAKNIIDCTGNGDVFARAGVEFTHSQEMQPMTLSFYFAEVEPNTHIKYEEEVLIPFGPEPGYLKGELMKEWQSPRRDVDVDRVKMRETHNKGEFPEYGGPWFGGLRERFPWVNTTRMYANGVKAAELTKAEMEGRKSAHQMIEYYRKEVPGFEKSWIMKTASTMGVRETRQLEGVYQLTGDDVVACREFDDSIAMGSWPIDIHPGKGKSGQHDLYCPLPYQIPYRIMVPKTMDNLLIAGRCVCVDREALGSIRVGATCGAMGHAAGVAAALSAQSGTTVRDVDIKLVQQKLLEQNAIIDHSQAR